VAARQRKSCEATLARADGVVLIKRMILLTSTTPAAATASAFPSSAEEGSIFYFRFAVNVPSPNSVESLPFIESLFSIVPVYFSTSGVP